MNIDAAKVEAVITPNTKAIIAVHLHGLPIEFEPLLEVAHRNGLKVVEDACQAHGARYQGRKVGTLGDGAAFNLNQNKCLSVGEGGLFVTDDEALYHRGIQVWSFGGTRAPHKDRDYHAYVLGWMYRNNDISAAFARAQLTKLDDYLAVQKRNKELLHAVLEEVAFLELPSEPMGCEHNWATNRSSTSSGSASPVTFAPRLLSCLRINHPVTGQTARLDSRPVAGSYLDRVSTYKITRPCQAATVGVP